jgi:hypothetical protein
MRLGPKAPADKVVQAARGAADNDLAAGAPAAEVAEVAERSLVAAVVELGAGQEVAREEAAHSAAEVAAVFFASK